MCLCVLWIKTRSSVFLSECGAYKATVADMNWTNNTIKCDLCLDTLAELLSVEFPLLLINPC